MDFPFKNGAMSLSLASISTSSEEEIDSRESSLLGLRKNFELKASRDSSHFRLSSLLLHFLLSTLSSIPVMLPILGRSSSISMSDSSWIFWEILLVKDIYPVY